MVRRERGCPPISDIRSWVIPIDGMAGRHPPKRRPVPPNEGLWRAKVPIPDMVRFWQETHVAQQRLRQVPRLGQEGLSVVPTTPRRLATTRGSVGPAFEPFKLDTGHATFRRPHPIGSCSLDPWALLCPHGASCVGDVQAVSCRVHSPSGPLAARGQSKPDLPVDCPAQSSAPVLQNNMDSVLSCYSDRFVRL